MPPNTHLPQIQPINNPYFAKSQMNNHSFESPQPQPQLVPIFYTTPGRRRRRRPSTSSSSSSSSDSNRITITSSMLESSETPIEEFKPENLPKKPIRDKRVRFNFEQKDSEALKPKVKKSLLKKHHSQFNFESDWPKCK